MSAQPEALRLAEIWSDYLPAYHYGQVARDTEQELRRLSAVETQRDALLEACKVALGIVWFGKEYDQIAAAIKAVEEQK